MLVARISPSQYPEPKVEDEFLIALAKQGDRNAYDRLVRRYYGFVRLKASSYFLAGGDSRGPHPGGPGRPLQGDPRLPHRPRVELPQLRRAVHHAPDHHGRQDRHAQQAQPPEPVRVVLLTPAGAGDEVPTLDQLLPGPTVHDPVNQVISSEELRSLVGCLSSALSELESRVLSLYLDGYSYEQVGERLSCDTKTVDNALQRVKRKVGAHLESRAVAA